MKEAISLRNLFFEGILYAIICLIITGLVSGIFLQFARFLEPKQENVPEIHTQIAYLSSMLNNIVAWILSSALFAKIKPKSTFTNDFIRFMIVGFLSYTIFFLLVIFLDHQPESSELANMLFMALWNFFSRGSSKFIIAFFSFFPAVLAFLLIIIFFIFLIWVGFYMLFKPIADNLLLPYEKRDLE